MWYLQTAGDPATCKTVELIGIEPIPSETRAAPCSTRHYCKWLLSYSPMYSEARKLHIASLPNPKGFV